MERRLLLLGYGFIVLVVCASVLYVHRNWVRHQLAMQTYEYDNGQGTTFTMKFYKGARVIPATERKMEFDPENAPKGSIITEQGRETGLTISIAKTNEIDASAREYCSAVERNVLRYTSKATGSTVPICLLGSPEGSHVLYLTQVEGAKGRHLVQIYKDFSANIEDEAQRQRIAPEVDLWQYRDDIVYILSSIEEK